MEHTYKRYQPPKQFQRVRESGVRTFNLIERKIWEGAGFEDRFRNFMGAMYDFTIFVEPSTTHLLEESEEGSHATIHGVTRLHEILDAQKAQGRTVHIVLNLPHIFTFVKMPTGAAQYSDYTLPIRVISDTARSATYKANAVTFIFEDPVPEIG